MDDITSSKDEEFLHRPKGIATRVAQTLTLLANTFPMPVFSAFTYTSEIAPIKLLSASTNRRICPRKLDVTILYEGHRFSTRSWSTRVS